MGSGVISLVLIDVPSCGGHTICGTALEPSGWHLGPQVALLAAYWVWSSTLYTGVQEAGRGLGHCTDLGGHYLFLSLSAVSVVMVLSATRTRTQVGVRLLLQEPTLRETPNTH